MAIGRERSSRACWTAASPSLTTSTTATPGTRPSNRHVNDQQTTGARAKLLAKPTADLTLTFTVDGVTDTSGSAYYAPVRPIIGGTLQSPIYGPTNLSYSYASQPPKNKSWDGGVGLKIAYTLSPNLTFNAITAYRGFAQDPVNYNNDGQPLTPYSNANPTPVSISDNFIVYREKALTQEFQLLGKYDRFDFAGGLYILNEDFFSNRIGYVLSPTAATAAPAFPEDQIGDTKTTNYAVYAQGNYHITDRLIATLGLRYTIEHRDFTFQGLYDTLAGLPIAPTPGASTSTPGGFAAANNFTYKGNKTWDSLTPKYGLSYQFAPTVFGYASVSKGFDAGGFNNRASSLATALPYNQEVVQTYEAGLKTEWLDRRLRANIAIFYNDYKGLQATASVISPVTNGLVSVRSNAGQAHTEGFELETGLQPIDGLHFTFNTSYLKTRFDSFPNAGTSVVNGQTVVVGASGNELPFSPAWQLYGGFDDVVPLGLPGQVRVGADVTYETSYFSDVFNYAQGQIPAQSYVDGFISYTPRDSHWVFTLTGRNLANSLNFQSLTWGGTPNLWEGPVNPPRTLFFKIAYSH